MVTQLKPISQLRFDYDTTATNKKLSYRLETKRQQCILAKLISIAVMTYSYTYHLRNLRPANLLHTQRINFSMRPQHVRMTRDPTLV